MGVQNLGPSHVIIFVVLIQGVINLNNQLLRLTKKVAGETAHGNLPPKLQALETAVPDFLPEQGFRICLVFPKVTSKCQAIHHIPSSPLRPPSPQGEGDIDERHSLRFLQPHQNRAVRDELANGRPDFRHNAVPRRGEGLLHLHGFHDNERIAFGDGVPGRAI